MIAPKKNKRILIWANNLDQDLLNYLRKENMDVVALLQGVSDEVPSFSIYDLFYRTEKLKFDEKTGSSIYLDDAFMYRYFYYISRISFVPLTEDHYCSDSGTVVADNVVDWAQFQAQTLLNLLQQYAPDEIWLFNKPQLGIDNLLVEVARQFGFPVLTFHQSMMPEKFFFESSVDRFANLGLEFKTPEMGSFKADMPYMKQCDKMHALEQPADHSGLARKQRKKSISRIYLAAQRREWAPLLLLMDCLCERTRENAVYRFVRRLRFRADFKKRVMSDQDDLHKPYVYFELRAQPEASNSAQGVFFSNQINAIEAIRAILPAGWWICVEENPQQRYRHRDTPFYMRARQWSDVKFIDGSTQSETLIKHSRIVATITGLAAYQALLLEKPCIYFGDAWYEGLPNAFRFNDALDLGKISLLKGEIQELGKAVDAKMTLAADGMVFPAYRKLLEKEAEWSSLMQTTAKSLVRISDYESTDN